MDDAAAIATLVIVVLGAWLWVRRNASRKPETQLRRICLGDDAQVERLIGAEMTRAPGITRSEAASRAVRRYLRDNR
jgi:hypothetical protein